MTRKKMLLGVLACVALIATLVYADVIPDIWVNNAEIDGELNHDGTTLGTYGVEPTTRPGATADIKDALVSLGLMQGSSATPLNLDGGTLTAGSGVISDLVSCTVVASNGSGALSCGTAVAPGGSNTHVQYNNSGAFGGESALTYNAATNLLTCEDLDATGSIDVAGSIPSSSAGETLSLTRTNTGGQLYFRINTLAQRYTAYTNAADAYPFSLGAEDTEYMRMDPSAGSSGVVVMVKPFNAIGGGAFEGGVKISSDWFAPAFAEVSAAGTIQANATEMSACQTCNVTSVTAASAEGVKIRTCTSSQIGMTVTVRNSDTADAVNLWPQSGTNIGAGVDTARSLAVGVMAICTCIDTNTWDCIVQ